MRTTRTKLAALALLLALGLAPATLMAQDPEKPAQPAAAAVSGMRRSPLPAASLASPPPTAASARIFTPWPGFSPVLSTSAAALPSGKASCCSTISARRSGTEKNTPRMPPRPAIASTQR